MTNLAHINALTAEIERNAAILTVQVLAGRTDEMRITAACLQATIRVRDALTAQFAQKDKVAYV